MTTTGRLPQQILDLRASLSTSEVNDRLDAIAPIAGLPKYSEIPRPGIAGTWSFRQWCTWGKDFGFSEDEGTNSCFTMKHRTGVVFSMSKTPGDYLSGYASTTQFKRQVAERLDFLAGVYIILIDYAIEGKFKDLPDEPDAILKYLSARMEDKAFALKVAKEYTNNLVGGATAADKTAWASIPGVMRVLDKEFKVGVRQAMTAIGHPELADKMALGLKHGAIPGAGASIVLVHLRAYLESLRAIRVQQNEERTKLRQAERDARSKTVQAGTRAKYDTDITNHRAKVMTCFATMRSIAQNMFDMTDRQMKTLESMAYPEYPGSPDELNQQVDALKAKLEDAEREREEYKTRSEADTTALNRMESDLLEAQAKALHGNDDLAKKVLDLTDLISRRLATTTDILSIGAAVKDVREASVALGQYVRTQHPELVKPADTPKAK